MRSARPAGNAIAALRGSRCVSLQVVESVHEYD